MSPTVTAKTRRTAFTLLELMVGMAVFAIVAAVSFYVLAQSSSIWTRSSDRVQAFQSVRLGFDIMTRALSQATLNTYLDYDNPDRPTQYLRHSDLRMVSGPAGSQRIPGTAGTGAGIFFAAPLGYTQNTAYRGLEGALNAAGYYISFDKDRARPSFVSGPPGYRYRLMQVLVPTEKSEVFVTDADWYGNNDVLTQYSQPVATNVIALILRPQIDAETAAYGYDSREGAKSIPQPITANQLPPSIHVTMVAIDEKSARRLENGTSEPPEITSLLSGKFTSLPDFQNDLDKLCQGLANARIDYRVFSSTVPIRESKWTKL